MRIIKLSVGIIAVLLFVYLGWIVFEKFSNASFRRNLNFAVSRAKEIKEAEVEFKSQFGRYAQFEELVNKNLISAKLTDGENEGYKFTIELKDDNFLIFATPKIVEKGIAFSMDKNGNVNK